MVDQAAPCRPLIHIGAAKAASTWLQANVFGAPTLGFQMLGKRAEQRAFLVPPELDFDRSAARQFFSPLCAQAAANQQCPTISLERLSGSSRLGDADAIEFAERLHTVFPDAKILYVVREQKSMLRAQFFQYVRRGGSRRLEWFLDQHGSNSESSAYYQWDRFKYADRLAQYQHLFGEDRVLVLPVEMLESEREAFFARLLPFSGLPPISDSSVPSAQAERFSQSSCSYAVVRRLNRFFARPNLFNPDPIWPVKNAKSKLATASRWIDHLFPHSAKRWHQTRTDTIIADRTTGYFGSNNIALQRHIGVDLSAYGYDLDV